MSKLTIGEQIKSCRKSKKITQKELANLSNLSEISIRKYEAGDRHPKIEQIHKIFNAMGTTYNDTFNQS